MLRRVSYCVLLAFITSSVYASSSESTVSADDDQQPITSVSIKHSKIHGSGAGAKTNISREKIKASGYISVQETLQRYGNLQMHTTSGQTNEASINLRGFGANADSNSLVLVNGVPLTNPDLAPPNLNNIPLSNISRIEITSGSEGVLYGDQAVGGVVNIITNETMLPVKRLACHYGSFQSRGCVGEFGSQYRNVNYAVSAAADHSDNYRDHNEDDQQHLNFSSKTNYTNGYLRADVNLLNENLEYPGALTGAQVGQDRRQAANNTDYFKDINGSVQLLEHHLLNDDWTLETALSGTHMSGQGVLSSKFTQARTSYFIKPTLKGLINDSAVSVGTDFQYDTYRLSSLYGLNEDAQQKFGGFTYGTVPLRDRLSLSIGARAAEQTSQLQSYVTNNNLNRAVATTAGLTYQITPESSAYIRRAGSFRFPKADENASTVPGSNGLRTQRGISYESGWQFERDSLAANVDVYQLNLKDEIAFDPLQTPLTPFGSNQNLAPTVRRGITFAGSDNLNSLISVDGQVNMLTAQFQNGIYKHNDIPLVADDLFHAGVQLNINDDWHSYVDANFTGSQFAANDYANSMKKLGGYTTYNWNVQYTHKAITATLRVNNIFNKYYYFYSAYQAWANDIYYYPAATRDVMLTVDYSLA